MRLLAALFLVAVAASDRVTAAPAPATYSRDLWNRLRFKGLENALKYSTLS